MLAPQGEGIALKASGLLQANKSRKRGVSITQTPEGKSNSLYDTAFRNCKNSQFFKKSLTGPGFAMLKMLESSLKHADIHEHVLHFAAEAIGWSKATLRSSDS